MILSELKVGEFATWDKLTFFRNGESDYIIVMPGEEVKRGSDISLFEKYPVEPATKEHFNDVLSKVDKTDALSHLYSEAFHQE